MKLPLKPCPFSCRCPAATFILGSGKWGIHVNSKANVHHESIYRVFGTEQEAAEWWNNRPGEAAILEEYVAWGVECDFDNFFLNTSMGRFKKEKGIE